MQLNLEDTMEGTVDSIPEYNSEVWFQYVMNQFRDYEKDGESPKSGGLDRVAQHLIGPVVNRTVLIANPPTKDNHEVSTVVVGMDIYIKLKSHPAHGMTIHIEEAADCGRYNTDAPFHLHQSATAVTRAESRIFRKLLGLSGVIAAEEKTENPLENVDDWSTVEPITESQINVIDALCRQNRLNLSVLEFINSGEKQYNSIYEISHGTATKMIQNLNQIQCNKINKPNIKTYDPNWRS